MYSLRSGLVKLIQGLPNGSERIVRLLRAGDVAGLEVLCHTAYRHTAIALGPVNGCRIPRASMAALDRHSPRLHEALLRRWEGSLERADLWISYLSTGSVAARLARLLRFLGCDGANPAPLCQLPHREDMAAMLGVATETLCRALSDFQRRGFLRRIDRSLFEFDAAAIDRLAAD